MTNELFARLMMASIVSPLVPLICLSIYWSRQPRQNRILAISIFISLVFDVISWVMGVLYHQPNSLPINLYFIIAFPAIMWFYHETLAKRSLKNVTRIFTLIFFLLAAVFIIKSGLQVVNHGLFMLSSILVSITSLLFIRDLNVMGDSDFLKNEFHKTNIFLNTSLATYYFATVIIFSVSDYVFASASEEEFNLFWAFHNILNISKNIGITAAFYLTAKRRLA
ncbi:MAG TPA: hypothetical protein VGD40_00610 [Chryseosolibacter sp.]